MQNNELATLSQAGQQAFSYELSSVNIYVLAYNIDKNLVGNPIATYTNSSVTDNVPNVLMSNIKNYLSNFKILTDTVQILDGYVVNFGVFFDVIAEKYANKQKIKLLCIEKIKDYFRIENGTDGYGYKYDFENALVNGIIRPPLPSSPSVFELKSPNQNIKGKVR